MDGNAPADDPESVMESVVVDVTALSLAELTDLTATGDSPLAHSLRRLLADIETPGEPIAGFNSAL